MGDGRERHRCSPQGCSVQQAEEEGKTVLEALPKSEMAGCYRALAETVLEVCGHDVLRMSRSLWRRRCTTPPPPTGGWGVVRMGHLMPESYQLFVSPAACGRHGAVSACMQGRKNRVSYLYLSEDDIVSGGYEDLLLEAVDGLLEHLARPIGCLRC